MRYLTGMSGLDDAGDGLLEILGRELGWDGAELWRMAGDERMRRFASWTAPGLNLDRFISRGERLAYEVGDGFPGMAWMSREPLWKADVTGEATAPCAWRRASPTASARPSRCRSAPTAEPIAVVVLVSRTPREPEAGLTRLLEAIGGQVTQFLQRREAEGQRSPPRPPTCAACPRSRTSWRARTTCSPRATRSAAPSATSPRRRWSPCTSRPAVTRSRSPRRSAPRSAGSTSSLTRARSPPRPTSAVS